MNRERLKNAVVIVGGSGSEGPDTIGALYSSRQVSTTGAGVDVTVGNTAGIGTAVGVGPADGVGSGIAVGVGWGSAAWVGTALGTAGSVGCVGFNTADDGGVVASEVAWVAGVEVGATAGAAVDVGGGAVPRAVFCNESCWQAASISAPAVNATIASRLNLMKIFSGKQCVKAREMLGKPSEGFPSSPPTFWRRASNSREATGTS